MLSKLQYISQGNTVQEQLLNIQHALDQGCDWIQMRFKNGTFEETFALAESVKKICHQYDANFIVNDNVSLAKIIDAEGVHLGLNDMPISKAREILGTDKIIGGTANTLEEVISQTKNGCDYIGLGPLRFTNTKANLSRIIGMEGYQTIMKELRTYNTSIPIYAIGGINLNDIEMLLATGIYGVASSSLITQSSIEDELIIQLNEKLYGTVII
ncbi:thiamine phosphate synthase [Flavobacterium weaverense]|uniref:Thiamine-phosphate synthase n=1 Tax=Flavobacterium weaverense TaxID=271156 RepID=A0A3L9ZZ84_9FLAO|nr:thiamine phosphate synthase [Flavobacterium weaverense]RMA77790.1 thiamine-phosphate diphosphorylase [Flavobacterium weaverense]